MNERIKQLYNVCNEFDSEEMEHNFNHVKFAELIVRECADWVNNNVGLIDEEARADLLKHFGVEEFGVKE